VLVAQAKFVFYAHATLDRARAREKLKAERARAVREFQFLSLLL